MIKYLNTAVLGNGSVHTDEIESAIGYFYLHKNAKKGVKLFDQIKATDAELAALKLASIKQEDGDIIIESGRPGLIIGRKGSNIEALEAYLRERFVFKTLCIKEKNLFSSLYDYQYQGYENFGESW